MFAPTTPTAERVRIQNENAELNRYTVERQSIFVGLINRLRLSRPKIERVPQTQTAVVRHVPKNA